MARYNSSIASVSPMKFGVGIPLPNPQFRDVNASMYTGTKTHIDGTTLTHTGVRDWTYVAVGNGSVSGSQEESYSDQDCLSLLTDNTTSTITLADHELGAMTAISGLMPMPAGIVGNYVQVNFVAKIDSDLTPGTHFRMALWEIWNNGGTYVNVGYELFDLSGLTIDNTDWTACEAKLSAALNYGLADYIQLHIGLYSPDGVASSAKISEISLMFDPISAAAATTYQDLSSVYVASPPGTGFEVRGVSDRFTLDGTRRRVNTLKGGPKHRLDALWHSEDEDAYDMLRNAFLLSTGQFSSALPEPVPLVCDFGVGMAPHWGYYDVIGSSFAGTFTEHWTPDSQRYDIGLSLAER